MGPCLATSETLITGSIRRLTPSPRLRTQQKVIRSKDGSETAGAIRCVVRVTQTLILGLHDRSTTSANFDALSCAGKSLTYSTFHNSDSLNAISRAVRKAAFRRLRGIRV